MVFQEKPAHMPNLLFVVDGYLIEVQLCSSLRVKKVGLSYNESSLAKGRKQGWQQSSSSTDTAAVTS